ncbi:MAG: helix-turn-helix domain-containing protein [Bacteroidota bacterium]
MNQTFSIFDITVIVGIVQGLLTSTLLLVKREHRSDTYLALAIIAFCLLSSKILLHTLGLWDTPIFRFFPLGIDLAIQPLIYFYVVLLIEPKTKISHWDFLHFLPFALSEIYSLIVYINVLSVTDLDAKDAIAEQFYFNQVKFIEDYLTLISVFTYLTIGLLILRNYNQWLETNISDSSYPTFKWLRNILLQLLVIGIFLLINLSLDRIFSFDSSSFSRWQLFYMLIAVHIYYLGFIGYKRTDYLPQGVTAKSAEVKKVSREQIDKIKRKVEEALEKDEEYLNPQLSASELAKKIGTSQSDLSYVINSGFRKNFRELINDYRVKEAKSKLIDPSCSHLSVVGIAFEAGFNSEASFYRIFKKATGMSPAEYQRSQSNKG